MSPITESFDGEVDSGAPATQLSNFFSLEAAFFRGGEIYVKSLWCFSVLDLALVDLHRRREDLLF